MTVPKENISNTVLLRALPITPVTLTWPMLLNEKDGPLTDQVELWHLNGTTVTPVDPSGPAGYTIQIQHPSYWEFIIAWTGSQPVGGTLYVFRRTRGVVEAFTIGSFLSAEALNQRFDLDNLGINDTAYYQSKTNPMYSKKAIALKGMPDFTSVPAKNPGLPLTDLELPYLGTGSPTFHDIYTWGKRITNSPNPGDGEFEQVLIGSSSGGGTVAQLVAELANDTSAGTAGGTLIGLWSAPNPNLTPPPGGWPGDGQTLEDWYLKMSVTTPLTDTGGTQIGINISGAGNWNIYHTPGPGAETSVQTYCNGLHFFGDASHLHYDSGASWIGYSGWGLNAPVVAPDGKSYNANTVAGCLNRLNDTATTPTASGASYVQWWSSYVSASYSVQHGLERLSKVTRVWDTLPNSTVGPIVLGQLPPEAIAGGAGSIDRIVFTLNNPTLNFTYSLVVTEVAFIVDYSIYPVYWQTTQPPMLFTFQVLPAGNIEVRKTAGVINVGATYTCGATVYLKADHL